MYKVGTRVKKVRSRFGLNIGNTGIVVDMEPRTNLGADIVIRQDQPWLSVDNPGYLHPAGTEASCLSSEWEPVIPPGSDVPSEATIHELLDSKFYDKENCNV